jgi:hypothetical protein
MMKGYLTGNRQEPAVSCEDLQLDAPLFREQSFKNGGIFFTKHAILVKSWRLFPKGVRERKTTGKIDGDDVQSKYAGFEQTRLFFN